MQAFNKDNIKDTLSNIGSSAYENTALIGKVHNTATIIWSVIGAILFLLLAYYNYNNWDRTIVDTKGTIISIDNDSGFCDSKSSDNTIFDCKFTVEYLRNNVKQKIQLNTNSYIKKKGDVIVLSYDTDNNNPPVEKVSRINTIWFLFISFILIGFSYITYLFFDPRAKAYLAAQGVNQIVNASQQFNNRR